MTAAFLLWEGLLLKLSSQRAGFCVSFIKALLSALCAQSSIAASTDILKNAKYEWLVRVLTSKQWDGIRSDIATLGDLLDEIMETCLLNPSHWTQQLGRILLDRGSAAFQKSWMSLYQSSLPQKALLENATSEDVEDTEMEDGAPEPDSELGVPIKSGSNKGWKLLEGAWVPRPIGV
jgi:hypothetical protein